MASLMERMKSGRGRTQETLQKAMAQSQGGGYQKDERIWKYGYVKHPTKKDPKKPAQALAYSSSVIRFLPTPFIDMRKEEAGELPEGAVLTPIVHLMSHDFKGPGGHYRENCIRTIGQDCPVNEHDRPFWDAWKEQGKPDNDLKKTLVGRLPKDEYYANILVIEDAANPENNGKVFLFKFSAAIKKMIDEAFDPSLPTAASFDPTDPFDGRDLHLTFIGEERSFNNWTGLVPVDMSKDSKWIETALCGGDEAKMEEVMEQAYSLQDFLKPTLFKSYADLKERLKVVLGLDSGDDGQVKPEAEPKHVMSVSTSAPVQAGDVVANAIVNAAVGGLVGGMIAGSSSAPVQAAGDDEMAEFERLLAEGYNV